MQGAERTGGRGRKKEKRRGRPFRASRIEREHAEAFVLICVAAKEGFFPTAAFQFRCFCGIGPQKQHRPDDRPRTERRKANPKVLAKRAGRRGGEAPIATLEEEAQSAFVCKILRGVLSRIFLVVSTSRGGAVSQLCWLRWSPERPPRMRPAGTHRTRDAYDGPGKAAHERAARTGFPADRPGLPHRNCRRRPMARRDRVGSDGRGVRAPRTKEAAATKNPRFSAPQRGRKRTGKRTPRATTRDSLSPQTRGTQTP